MSITETTSTAEPANPRCPRCSHCGASSAQLTRHTTRSDNPNGNAGRLYLKCSVCDRFVTFLDGRGIKHGHPVCACGFPSRLQVAGVEKGRGLHVTCSVGACGFWESVVDEDGEEETLTEELVGELAGLHM